MTHKCHERNEESCTYQKSQNYLQVGKVTKYVKESGDERDVKKRKYKWEGRREEKRKDEGYYQYTKEKRKKKKK